jgi:hypothetical protein
MTDKATVEPQTEASERRYLVALLILCMTASAIRLGVGLFVRYRWGPNYPWGLLGCCINVVQAGLTLLCALPALAPGPRRKSFVIATIMGAIAYVLTLDMCPPVGGDD